MQTAIEVVVIHVTVQFAILVLTFSTDGLSSQRSLSHDFTRLLVQFFNDDPFTDVMPLFERTGFLLIYYGEFLFRTPVAKSQQYRAILVNFLDQVALVELSGGL